MKRIIPAIVAISVATTGLAFAQSTPSTGTTGGTGSTTATPLVTPPSGTTRTDAPPSTSTAPAAVTTTAAPSRTTEAPVPGANSFTEGQARSRIEERGFAQVSDLRKDDQGIWRAKAMKDGRSVNVALDYQGNIVGQ